MNINIHNHYHQIFILNNLVWPSITSFHFEAVSWFIIIKQEDSLSVKAFELFSVILLEDQSIPVPGRICTLMMDRTEIHINFQIF